MSLRRKVLNRIDVQNDPVNFVDPFGLFNFKAFRRGVTLTASGIAGMYFGATMSSTGLGAIIGVPTAVAGAGTFAGGVVQTWVAILEPSTVDHVVPPGSMTGAVTAGITGDINKAIMNDALVDVALTGTGVVCGIASTEKNIINLTRAQAGAEMGKLSAGTATGIVAPTINLNEANK